MADNDLRRVAFVTVAVVVLMAVASFGFQSVSSNPLVPKTDVEIRDADDPLVLNDTTDTDIVAIEHKAGEPVPLDEVMIIFGPRTEGLNFSASNNWTSDEGILTLEAQLNGENVTSGETFEAGDTLTITKTAGRGEGAERPEITVRLYHYPSQQVFGRATVQIE